MAQNQELHNFRTFRFFRLVLQCRKEPFELVRWRENSFMDRSIAPLPKRYREPMKETLKKLDLIPEDA